MNEPVAILSQANSHLEKETGESVRMEDTPCESEPFARSTLDALSAHLAILDETTTIIAVNRSWRRFAEANATTLTGLAEGANYLTVCDTATGPDSEGAAAFAAGIRAILQGARDEFTLEYPCHSPTQKRWFLGRVTRFTADGVPRLVVAHEDITERRRAEAVLLESEERYRRVSEMIVDFAYSCLKPAGGAFAIDWLVGAVERISGYPANEVRSHGCWKFFVHPADVPLFENRVIGLKPGDAGECELRIVHKDGTIRWIRALSRVTEDRRNALSHRLFGTCEDITERRHSEQKLKQSEERFKVLFEDSRDALMTLEPPSWTFSEGNTATLEMFGAKTREEFLSCNPWQLSPERQRDGCLSNVKSMEMCQTAMREGSHFFEWTHKRMDGEEFPATVRLSRTEYHGKMVLLATVRDITQRKRAEDALRESEERWQFALEGAGDGVWDWNAQTNELFYSRQWKAMLGYEEDEIGTTLDEWDKRVHPEDKERCHADLQRHFAGETPVYQNEHRLLCKDGSYKWILDRGKVIQWLDDGRPLRVIGTHTDVSERKQRNEALREANEFLNNLIDHANAPIIVWDPEYRITRFNRAFEKLTGRTSREVIGQSLEILFPPEQADVTMAFIQGTQPVEHWEAVEIGIQHLDGTVCSVLWNSATIFAADGVTPVATIAQGHDITARKEAEKALRESEGRYRTIFNHAPLGIVHFDSSGIIRDFNDHLGQILGAPREKILGFNMLERLKDPAMLRAVQDALAGKSGRYESDYRSVTGGKTIPVRAIYRRMTSEDGSILGAVGLFEDITERRRAEAALRETNEYLDNLINYANAPIIVWNPEYRITRFNRAFEKLTGRTSQEVIGQPLEILFPPEQVSATMSFIQETQPAERWETVEIGIQRSDGTVRSVLWNSATILAPDGITPVATIAQGHDITERKQAEAEKAKLQAQTWQLHKAESLGRMAGAIAHHFNNQLQAVTGYLELAMDNLPPGHRSHADVVQALKASDKASEISSLMLAYLGQTSGNRELVDLSEVCRRGLPMLRSAMPKGAFLEADLPCPGPVVRANANQIQQVLANLITNAWEAFGDVKGAVRLTVRTVSPAEIPSGQRFPVGWEPQESPHACLEVADTGCGIGDENLENLFDPFFSSKFTGRGLGLAVLLGIVRAHGGAVTVESEPGRGSVFRVFVPVSVEKAPSRPEHPDQTAQMAGSGTVLLVEDDEMLCALTEEMLTGMGFTVLAAKDGVEAVEVFREHGDEIGCVLMDLTLPNMDGWQTLAALRALRPDLPVVLVSGYDEARALQGDHPEVPQAFLHKPYRMENLKAALSKAQKAANGRFRSS